MLCVSDAYYRLQVQSFNFYTLLLFFHHIVRAAWVCDFDQSAPRVVFVGGRFGRCSVFRFRFGYLIVTAYKFCTSLLFCLTNSCLQKSMLSPTCGHKSSKFFRYQRRITGSQNQSLNCERAFLALALATTFWRNQLQIFLLTHQITLQH